ncbi:MAG: hypothetical protein ACTHLE_24270 [Agriterribacter sp.]
MMAYTKITNENIGTIKQGDSIVRSDVDLSKEHFDESSLLSEIFRVEKIQQGSIADGVALPGLIDQEYQVSNNDGIEEKALSRKDLLDNWWIKE